MLTSTACQNIQPTCTVICHATLKAKTMWDEENRNANKWNKATNENVKWFGINAKSLLKNIKYEWKQVYCDALLIVKVASEN